MQVHRYGVDVRAADGVLWARFEWGPERPVCWDDGPGGTFETISGLLEPGWAVVVHSRDRCGRPPSEEWLVVTADGATIAASGPGVAVQVAAAHGYRAGDVHGDDHGYVPLEMLVDVGMPATFVPSEPQAGVVDVDGPF